MTNTYISLKKEGLGPPCDVALTLYKYYTNVLYVAPTLYKYFTNVIQMFCVYWVAALYEHRLCAYILHSVFKPGVVWIAP